MSSALLLHTLYKTYTQRDGSLFTAVSDLTLTIGEGQIFGFLGPNGAGKTTTIKMVCNLITPTSGTIELNGYNVATQRPQALRYLGAVLEGTRNIYWQLSPWQNLTYFGKLKNCSGKKLTQRATYLLKQLDLWDKKDEQVNGFSRGMQQKVAIACAMVHDPAIIVLDEPTLGLDVQASRAIKQWLEHLARTEGKTIVLTTHQLDIAEQLCDQIAIINHGKLIANKPTHELLQSAHASTYTITLQAAHLAPDQVFDQMAVTYKDGITHLSGQLKTQQELHHLLQLIQHYKLPLISITPVHDNLEEVFMRMLTNTNRT